MPRGGLRILRDVQNPVSANRVHGPKARLVGVKIVSVLAGVAHIGSLSFGDIRTIRYDSPNSFLNVIPLAIAED